MVFANYNDEIRTMLKKVIDKYCFKGFTINESVDFFRDALYNLEVSEQKKDLKTRENCILCVYLDTLYITIYKHKNSMMKIEDVDLLNRLYQINGKDDLLAEVSCDPNFFSKLIFNSYEFNSLTNLGKIILVKSLTNIERNWIISKNVMHLMDLNTYGQEIAIDDLILDIETQIKEQDKLLDIEFEEEILLNISGFISNIMRFDQSNGIKLLLNLGKIDYAVSKYLEKMNVIEDDIVDHIDYYENYSLDDIIYRLTYDMSFLQSALVKLISLYIHKSYNDLELNDDLMNNNAVKKLDKKFNKK